MIGLILIALGTGGIKPCVSAFGGDQFTPDQVIGDKAVPIGIPFLNLWHSYVLKIHVPCNFILNRNKDIQVHNYYVARSE